MYLFTINYQITALGVAFLRGGGGGDNVTFCTSIGANR